MNCKVCGNTSTKNTSISFFRFPKENSKCRDWADRCNLLELFEKHGTLRFYKSFRICSQHFDPKDVVFDGRKNRLLQSATPLTSRTAKNPSVHEDAQNFNLELPQNLCRLCAEENDNLTDIFGWKGRLLNLESKLKYFPQLIDKHDILPLKICNECISKVNNFYDFIINCTKAETKLRAMLDLRDRSSSCQLTKSDTDSDEKVDWDSGMEMSLNETPKAIHSPESMISFPENMTGNYYGQVFGENSIADDDVGDYFCETGEADFTTTNHSHGHTNFIKVEFSNNISFKHDYSNMVSRDRLHSEQEIQTPHDQTFIQASQFSCVECLESFHDSEALRAHSLTHSVKWDLNGERLSDFCDEVFCGRFQLENASPSEARKYACKVCDKKLNEVAFLDNHSHQLQKDLRPCEIRRESKTEARLKCFLKCDRTKSSLTGEFNQSHSKLDGRSCRFWERLVKNQVRLTREKTQAGESHQCSECRKYFRSKASLRQHRPVHSEKRLHNCQECGMSFKRKDTLCNHLRIHTGERPFMCKICGFAFKQRGDCIKHERNHSKYSEVASKRECVRIGNEVCDSAVVGSPSKRNVTWL